MRSRSRSRTAPCAAASGWSRSRSRSPIAKWGARRCPGRSSRRRSGRSPDFGWLPSWAASSGYPGRMFDVTDDTFERDVLQSGTPIVLDFWAPWCGPCKAVEPILAQLEAESSGRVEFARLNIDENPVTAARYDVLSIPTAILFDAGEARATLVGAQLRARYEQALAEVLPAA